VRGESPVAPIETERLLLREMTVEDASFVLELLNEPSFIRHIGDRGVRTVEQARRYLLEGAIASYRRLGFGMYLVTLKRDGAPVGMCGLVKREGLDHVDLGFAFPPRHWSQGYASESARAVVEHARRDVGLERIAAIATPDNQTSIRLLGKLGFVFERAMRLPGESVDLHLFSRELRTEG
jgi:RimJ/RimL family protein N-acetyltransferase